nr:MAG TPA: hypothetical protein [Caudoviricetes sp.]
MNLMGYYTMEVNYEHLIYCSSSNCCFCNLWLHCICWNKSCSKILLQ